MSDTRTETNEEVLSRLNELISICKDGEQGFATAAEGVEDAQLKALCLQYSAQRLGFARELQNEVQQLGGTPEKSGTVTGGLHRGWIDIKSVVTGRDEAAIISECERGEDVAKESYEKALNAYMPAGVTGVIQRQYSGVKEAHDRFSAMQKAARA